MLAPPNDGTALVTVASSRSEAVMVARTTFAPSPVNVRIKISALWMSMLVIFAYVDLFSLYRADVRADIEAGELGGFAIGEGFLLGVTAYIVVPSLMMVGALVLPASLARIANIVLAILYALTIVGGAVGE
jgi:hypothetical protein